MIQAEAPHPQKPSLSERRSQLSVGIKFEATFYHAGIARRVTESDVNEHDHARGTLDGIDDGENCVRHIFSSDFYALGSIMRGHIYPSILTLDGLF